MMAERAILLLLGLALSGCVGYGTGSIRVGRGYWLGCRGRMPLRSSEQVVCRHNHGDETRGAAADLTLNVPRAFPSPGIETTSIRVGRRCWLTTIGIGAVSYSAAAAETAPQASPLVGLKSARTRAREDAFEPGEEFCICVDGACKGKNCGGLVRPDIKFLDQVRTDQEAEAERVRAAMTQIKKR